MEILLSGFGRYFDIYQTTDKKSRTAFQFSTIGSNIWLHQAASYLKQLKKPYKLIGGW